MKTTLQILVVGVLLLVAGCATYGPRLTDARTRQFLVFDRIPGNTYATDIAYRPDWPTADGGAVIQYTVDFTEHFIDYQGRDNSGQNEFTRRFTTRRRGVIVR